MRNSVFVNVGNLISEKLTIHSASQSLHCASTHSTCQLATVLQQPATNNFLLSRPSYSFQYPPRLPSQVDMNTVRYLRKAWSGAFNSSSAQTVSGISEPATPTSSAGNKSHQEPDSSHTVPISANACTATLSPSYEQVPVSQPAFQPPASHAEVTSDTPVLHTDGEPSKKAQATQATSPPPAVYMEDLHDDPLSHDGASFHGSEHDEFPDT
jgi:hypothetical protein